MDRDNASSSDEERRKQKAQAGRPPQRHRPGVPRRSNPRPVVPLTRRHSSHELRSQVQAAFLPRVRASRSQSAHRFGEIVQSLGAHPIFTCVVELRRALSINPQAAFLLQEMQLQDVLHLIEEDMFEMGLIDQVHISSCSYSSKTLAAQLF
ncbi:unnamed protein product [Acanthoscelides obtectus]|uniref:Uncharacterized protein n=1 Tax=Acanthoscelides obtectus TaxID=200917 RepID=A0A9P0K668_ACAOB|nr:unnamed protein product [Acanthoscelides obtectus]CAK1629121.1 hypothetical protein AOBTE_LOCUS5592 [Acanthoscelides obtectus]